MLFKILYIPMALMTPLLYPWSPTQVINFHSYLIFIHKFFFICPLSKEKRNPSRLLCLSIRVPNCVVCKCFPKTFHLCHHTAGSFCLQAWDSHSFLPLRNCLFGVLVFPGAPRLSFFRKLHWKPTTGHHEVTTLALLTLDTRGQTKIKFHNCGLVLLEPESIAGCKHISADEQSVSSELCRFQYLSYFVELYCQMISMRSNSFTPTA